MAIALITKGKICLVATSGSPGLTIIDNRIVNLKINLKRDSLFKMQIKILTNIVKGDTLLFECTIDDDITDWKIRAEVSDRCTHEIKLATSNVVGGSADQINVIEVTPTSSKFLVQVPSGATDCFEDKSKFEIEVETPNTVGGEPEKVTVFQADINFKNQEITWEDVSL